MNPDGSPVTVSGAAAMIQGNSIIIGDAIARMPSTAAASPTLIAGLTVTPLAHSVAIDGKTLRAGDPPLTIAGTLYSLDSNDYFAANPTIQALPTPPPPPGGTLLNSQTTAMDGQELKVFSNGVSIAGTALAPGGPAATVSGIPISLGSTALIIDGTTIPVSLGSANFLTTTIDDHVIIAAPSSVILQGTSLEPGSPGITISNELISLNKAGSLILGSHTIALSGADLTTRIGNEMITAAPTGVQIAGATLLPDASSGWTIDGTRILLNVMGDVIIGGKTIAPGGEDIGVGGLILAAFHQSNNGLAASTSSSLSLLSADTEAFEGAGTGRKAGGSCWTVAAVVVVAVVVLAIS